MATINGTNGNDTLNGVIDLFFDLPDTINGFDGNDILNALGTNDTLNGGNGNDTLNGGAGADKMNGGDGSDTYFVDNIGDVVGENFNDALGGVDTVFSSVSYSLSPGTVSGGQGFGIENLTLTGFANINATGNGNNNVLTGNSGNNSLSGLAGNDTLNGGNGNDTLDGGLGADKMNGGDGSDTYFVDNIGDVVGENFNDALGGVDTVFSSVSYSLSPGTVSGGQGFGIENLTLTGFANINATGNGNNNVITGNSGNNTLNGGLGADTMNGGDGSDTYFVDNVGDVVAETFNDALGGVDSVFSSVNHTLGFGIENLTLTGFANINATGNGNNNVLTGNSGNNTLNGGLGADTMNGGDGSDTYFVDNVGDVVGESFNDTLGGVDTVFSSVSYSLSPGTVSGGQGFGIENLTLTGSANINGTGNGNNNVLTGNSGNNTLTGLAGNDTLVGGLGNDSLIGGSGIDTLFGNQGADKFIFNQLSEGIDIIKDFQWTEGDTIQISGFGFGASSLSQFSYNSFTGALFFDPAGLTGPTQFATIENKPAGFSTNLDIVIV